MEANAKDRQTRLGRTRFLNQEETDGIKEGNYRNQTGNQERNGKKILQVCTAAGDQISLQTSVTWGGLSVSIEKIIVKQCM